MTVWRWFIGTLIIQKDNTLINNMDKIPIPVHNFPVTDAMKDIRGFLIDIDGVLYVGPRAIEGASDAISFLKDNGYPFRCVSNTTRKCRHSIASHLASLGFDIPEQQIFTPPLAAIAHMKKTGKTGYYLLSTGDVDRDFTDLKNSSPGPKPDWVIIGDAGDRITYKSMNTAFRYLMEGSELLALENDRYWMAADGLSLSAGPIVKALEYATGKTATVMGKPSQLFFNLALQDMHLDPEQVAMIGDDITTDIGGAYYAGMKGILVRTGKFRSDSVDTSIIKPTCIIDSVSHIQDVLLDR
jgi:HAD superfamily hydrolase (TIGR01458 family)